jgi:hypothetical protein
VWPSCSALAAAVAGATLMPQVGSVTLGFFGHVMFFFLNASELHHRVGGWVADGVGMAAGFEAAEPVGVGGRAWDQGGIWELDLSWWVFCVRRLSDVLRR